MRHIASLLRDSSTQTLRGRAQRSAWVALLCLLLLATVGCRTETAPDGGQATETDAPRGTAVVAFSVDITGVNELVTEATTISTAVFYYGLFVPLAEEQANYQEGPPTVAPRLASSWEFSEDRTQLTFHLRDDAVWSDGAPITADDVRFTWEAQIHPDIAWTWIAYKENISDVEVVDPHTVVFHFSKVTSSQLLDAIQGVILPQHVWGQIPFEQWTESNSWFRDHLVVSGPFDLESWQPGQRFVLRANPKYFDYPQSPEIERVVFEIIPDRQNQLALLRAGKAHLMELIQPEDAASVEADPDLELLTYIPRFYSFIGWNTTEPPFDDALVRKAMTHAIDRQAIVDSIYYGYAAVSHSPIPSDVWAHNGEIEPWPYDPNRARELLAEAGWSDTDGDGLVDKDGKPLRFVLQTNSESPVRRDVITMVQQQLARVGVEAELRFLEFNSMLRPLSEQKFQAVMSVLAISTDLDLSYNFHPDGIANGYNWGAFDDPEANELMERIKTYEDPADAADDLMAIQRVLHEKQPVTFLYEARRLTTARTSLQDVEPNTMSPFANLTRWRLVDPDDVAVPAPAADATTDVQTESSEDGSAEATGD